MNIFKRLFKRKDKEHYNLDALNKLAQNEIPIDAYYKLFCCRGVRTIIMSHNKRIMRLEGSMPEIPHVYKHDILLIYYNSTISQFATIRLSLITEDSNNYTLSEVIEKLPQYDIEKLSQSYGASGKNYLNGAESGEIYGISNKDDEDIVVNTFKLEEGSITYSGNLLAKEHLTLHVDMVEEII